MRYIGAFAKFFAPKKKDTAHWYREETGKIRKDIEVLRAKRSPISTSAEAAAALSERLDILNARAEYLDALLTLKEEKEKAKEWAEVLEAENRVKELKFRGAPTEEIQTAENQLGQLRLAFQQKWAKKPSPKGGTEQT